jgi:hypothetical protein
MPDDFYFSLLLMKSEEALPRNIEKSKKDNGFLKFCP